MSGKIVVWGVQTLGRYTVNKLKAKEVNVIAYGDNWIGFLCLT